MGQQGNKGSNKGGDKGSKNGGGNKSGNNNKKGGEQGQQKKKRTRIAFAIIGIGICLLSSLYLVMVMKMGGKAGDAVAKNPQMLMGLPPMPF